MKTKRQIAVTFNNSFLLKTPINIETVVEITAHTSINRMSKLQTVAFLKSGTTV